MSGPIIRKYGFPNFEKIFGERDLKHGAEPEASKPEAGATASEPAKSDQASGATPETPKVSGD